MKQVRLITPSRGNYFGIVGGLFAFTLFAATAGGALTLVDDFESFGNGDTITGTNGWTGSGNQVAVTDPDDASNVVLQFPADGNQVLEKPFASALANGDTATLFYQFRIDSTAARDDLDQGIGTAGGGNAFQNYRSFNGLRVDEIQYRDGGSFETAVATNDVAIGTWYSAWMVVDQGTGANGTFDFYLSEGLTAAAGTPIASNIGFRTDSGGAIDRFLLRNGGSTLANADDAFLDNIYWDNSGENLANPIPEPSTYALGFGFLGLAMVMIRRCRRR